MNKTINWTKRGGCHVGASGTQKFIAMPDGADNWLLTEVGRDGKGVLLAHNLPDETAAMVVALDFVHVGVPSWRLSAYAIGAVLLTLLVVASVRPPV